MTTARTERDRRRAGYTLAELMVALALSGVVGAALCGVLVAQQRIYRNATERLTRRHAVRDAAEVLPVEIRGVATGEDLPGVLTDTAIELYSVVGSSVLCAPSATELVLPPDSLASGARLTSFAMPPDSGDLAAVYTEPADSSQAPFWERIPIAEVSRRATATACPAATSFTSPADGGALAYVITLRSPPVVARAAGVPVRVLRRGRFSVYRSSDGSWNLGYRRCGALVNAACAAIQPLSGPYASASAGLRFRYRDAVGNFVLGSRWSSVAAVEIAIRSVGRLNGIGTIGDSTVVTTALRNGQAPPWNPP